MRVVHAQAERILKEYGKLAEGDEKNLTGVPGYERLEYKLGSPDEHGHADLEIVGDAHASAAAFAKAAGIIEAVNVPAELEVLEQPKIIGLPNVGQYVTASAGVWAEPDEERLGDPGVTPSGVVLRWLYDGNEEDPVVIPEGDPHGYGSGSARDLRIPADALGKSIVLRVTRGRTTVYSEPFGPIEGGLTEFTFPAQPVPDRHIITSEPASRSRSGASAPGAEKTTKARSQTPSTAAKSRAAAKVQQHGKAVTKTGDKVKVPKTKKEALAKRAAENMTPPPAADPSTGE